MAEGTKNSGPLQGLSNRDIELLIGALKSTKGGPITVDYEVFADICGFKNVTSAKVSWYGVKRKFDALAGGSPHVQRKAKTPKCKAPDTPGKEGIEQDDNELDIPNSSKRKRTSTTTIKEEPAEGEDDFV